MFKTILFPIDQSREAHEAAEKVVGLVNLFKSRLVLLSVLETPAPGEEVPENQVMASAEAVALLLQNAQALFAKAGIEAEVIEREGNPAFTICDVADEVDAELIVMGCRGTGLTDEGAADSVSNRVINLSPCPILIVP